MTTTNYAMQRPQEALNEMLRLYVPSVQKRVYPPGIRQDFNGARINITPLTPVTRRWLGRRFGSGGGKWLEYTFRVEISDKTDPNMVDKIASEIDYAIETHSDYTPTDSTYGFFVNLKVDGGSATELNAGLAAYQKTLNVVGRWLSQSPTVF